MKVLMINSVCGIGSTGRICTDLAQQFEADGHKVKIAYGRDNNVPEKFQKYAIRIGNDIDIKVHGLQTRVLDTHGFGSKQATKKFLLWAEEYKPDLLWLHNLHGYYIHIELLFDWIKKHPDMQVKWTLHDCWAFTGHCSHFSFAKCEQWKTHCKNCSQKDRYPTSKLKDNCYQNFENKKRIFTGVKNMTLITPSQWLADLVKQSYLAKYPVEVHYNKIDTTVFKPTPSNFREKYGLEDKKIILGVASVWDERKGLDDFIELSKMLDDSYVIVLVGLSEKQIEEMPKRIVGIKRTNSPEKLTTVYIKDTFVNANRENSFEIKKVGSGMVIEPNIQNLYKTLTGNEVLQRNKKENLEIAKLICIQRTSNVKQLAEIYTVADVFVNTTYEDNYPTVNLEAQACGTYVITYDTGGCRETLLNKEILKI